MGVLWSILEYLRQGGWVMLPLAAVSWAMWTFIIERWRRFEELKREDLDPAAAARCVAGLGDCPEDSRGLRALLVREFLPQRSGFARLDRQILRQCAVGLHAELDRRLAAIGVLAAVAPLLGLLGTVLGMIETFDVISLFGTGNARAMAGGISVALITTQTGLLVAIPGLVLSSRLRRSAQLLKTGLDETTARLARQMRDASAETEGSTA